LSSKLILWAVEARAYLGKTHVGTVSARTTRCPGKNEGIGRQTMTEDGDKAISAACELVGRLLWSP